MIQALSSLNYQLLLLYSLLFDRDFPFFMGIHNKLFCLLFVYSKTLFVKHYTSSCGCRYTLVYVCVQNYEFHIGKIFPLWPLLCLGVFKKNEWLRAYEMLNKILAPIYTEAITEVVSMFFVGIRIAFINFCRLFKQ